MAGWAEFAVVADLPFLKIFQRIVERSSPLEIVFLNLTMSEMPSNRMALQTKNNNEGSYKQLETTGL